MIGQNASVDLRHLVHQGYGTGDTLQLPFTLQRAGKILKRDETLGGTEALVHTAS
ncbi:hypothetical protein D3C86_2068990 [compost metagenome]